MKEDTSGEFDQGSLSQEREWSIGKGKIAIRNVPERNPMGVLQDIAEIPQNAEP
jgi:hypothetical protein